MPGVGVPAAAVFLAETLGKTFDTGAQPASHIRPGPGHTPLRLIDPQWSASSATSDHSLAAGLAIGLGYA